MLVSSISCERTLTHYLRTSEKVTIKSRKLETMTNGSDLLLNSLSAYYAKNPHHRDILYHIVNGTSPLSLRVIDWFVTHYAKSHNIVYWINKEEDRLEEVPELNSKYRKFNVYLDTRAQLKSYTKLHFDPFRRHNRISFVLESDPLRVIETTVGQLNFFRWALQNHLLEYIQNHLVEIEEHMSSYQKKGKVHSSQSPVTSNTVLKAPCCVRFD
jgi:hypothetical protein